MKVICWTEAGKKTVLLNLDYTGFADKIDVVRLAVPGKGFVKDYTKKGGVKLLFVGSANIPGEFIYKGGNEVLEAFVILRRSFPNLELVIRSDMPEAIKARYKGVENLRIINGVIPWEQLEHEFKSADIFLFPSYATPGLAIIDAMSYELPVITTDVWANPELVDDGKTGFVVPKSERPQYYAENFIPVWSYMPNSKFMKAIRNADSRVVKDLVKKTAILIENEPLRKTMGKAAREEVETGKYSIMKRNEKLKKIFDEATQSNDRRRAV